MDLSKYRQKLIGSEEERAVSPVIGVILMVAITVILAAVIAAFVLDMGDSMGSGSVNAGVSSDVSNSDENVTLTVDNMGDAEEFALRGDVNSDEAENVTANLTATGDKVTFNDDSSDGTPGALSSSSGEANVVAISGDSESVVATFEWDWT